MEDKEIKIKLPNDLIMIDTTDLTARRIKIYRYLLSLIKNTKVDSQGFYTTSFLNIKKLYNIHRYEEIKEEIIVLKYIKLEINLEKIISISSLISQIDFLDDNNIKIKFPFNIIDMVLNTKNDKKISFAYFDLHLISKLKSKYSILIFEKILKTYNPKKFYIEIPKYTIELFRKWLGVENSLKTIQHLKTNILEVVKAELEEKTDFIFSYELLKENSRKYTHIKLLFKHKSKMNTKVPIKDKNLLMPTLDSGKNDSLIEEFRKERKDLLKTINIQKLKIDSLENAVSMLN